MWSKLLTVIGGRPEPPSELELGERLVEIALVQHGLLERIEELEEQAAASIARADRALAN